ncbi:hypothetical protein [Mycobacterium marinum]|uniref:hypothetical protein n=1 Tax=Mycobacterium marinum TaxID=1781 RepID=UPI0012937A29|nr:hypothetical protein [Mycobacterium marinum]
MSPISTSFRVFDDGGAFENDSAADGFAVEVWCEAADLSGRQAQDVRRLAGPDKEIRFQ